MAIVTHTVLQLSSNQFNAVRDGNSATLRERLWAAFRRIEPDTPALCDATSWHRWWNEMVDSARELGASDERRLAFHAVATFLYGACYLDEARLDWLRDLLTDEGRHAPDYTELDACYEEALAVLGDVVHGRG